MADGRKSLQWFKDIGPVVLTHYERLYVWKQDMRIWRHVVIDDNLSADVTGPAYETKTEALAALPEIAAAWDCRLAS